MTQARDITDLSLEERSEVERLEKKKHAEAEERLRTYFTRISEDPIYDYEGREEDVALIRRKRREGREREVRGGRGNSYGGM